MSLKNRDLSNAVDDGAGMMMMIPRPHPTATSPRAYRARCAWTAMRLMGAGRRLSV
jgi:hypothetical protein